jgi:AraC-like DNA-binding protein
MTTLRKMAMEGYPELARELGVNPTLILQNHGLPYDFFSAIKVDDLMTLEQAENLIRSLANQSGQHHCGALLGIRHNINFLGIIGYIMQQSNTVESALQTLQDHLNLHAENAQAGISNYGDFSGLYWISPLPYEYQKHTNEVAMAQGIVILKALIGNQLKVKAVHFSHTEPNDTSPYRKIFQVPVSFEQSKNEIIFNSKFLEKKIIKADPLLKEILNQQIEKLQPQQSNNLIHEVDILIRRSLQSQQYHIEKIAKHFSLHPRTLQRKLQDMGTSYSELLEEIRRNIAKEQLSNTNISITQLSDYLGYADNTALTRAFKRWFGMTPTEWKKQHKI